MSKRRDWEFEFSGDTVALAAQQKAEHHRKRLAFWQSELELADQTLRESAEVREMPVSGGVRPDIVFDQQAQKRWQECTDKVERHQKLVDEYDAYGKVCSLSDSLMLQQDDVLFFGLVAS